MVKRPPLEVTQLARLVGQGYSVENAGKRIKEHRAMHGTMYAFTWSLATFSVTMMFGRWGFVIPALALLCFYGWMREHRKWPL